MIAEIIGILADRLFYVVGRVVILLFSFGRWQSEPWRPQIWTSELFSGPFAQCVNGQLLVTPRGVRWAASGVIVMMGFVFAGLVLVIMWG